MNEPFIRKDLKIPKRQSELLCDNVAILIQNNTSKFPHSLVQ